MPFPQSRFNQNSPENRFEALSPLCDLGLNRNRVYLLRLIVLRILLVTYYCMTTHAVEKIDVMKRALFVNSCIYLISFDTERKLTRHSEQPRISNIWH